MKAKRISLRSLLVISLRAAGRHCSHALRLPLSLFKPASGRKWSESRRSTHSCSQPGSGRSRRWAASQFSVSPPPPPPQSLWSSQERLRLSVLPSYPCPTPPHHHRQEQRDIRTESERDAAFNPKMRSMLKASSCQGSTLLEAGRSDVNCKYPRVMMMMVFCFV